MEVAELTVKDMLLLAAHGLERKGRNLWTSEELVMSAWEAYPDAFGLRGRERDHPDSNRVLASLMGQRGLAQCGLLDKMGVRLYQLSHAGRASAMKLSGGGAAAPAREPRTQERTLPPAYDRLLKSLFGSDAASLHEQGRATECTFALACAFWGDATEEQIEGMDAQLKIVMDQIGGDAVTLSDGRSVVAGDVGRLRSANMYLLVRYARHLKLQHARKAAR